MSDTPPVGESERPVASGNQIEGHGEAVKLLSDGFIGAFLPELTDVQERVKELTLHQDILIETMQQENAKFAEDQLAKNLATMISYVGVYQNRLLKLKQDMALIQERVTKLKRRSLRLKAQKEKEELSRAEAQERERELERQLTAKLAPEYTQ